MKRVWIVWYVVWIMSEIAILRMYVCVCVLCIVRVCVCVYVCVYVCCIFIIFEKDFLTFLHNYS